VGVRDVLEMRAVTLLGGEFESGGSDV